MSEISQIKTELRDMRKMLRTLLEKFTDTMPETKWISEEDFKAYTGKNTSEKLRYFRKQNPDLWKAAKTVVVYRGGKPYTKNIGFLYDYAGYLKSHHSPLDSTNTSDLAA